MYDYIIVGAGSAVAAPLSEDPASSVLLLEGGPPDDLPEIAMPAATPTLWSGPLTWDNRDGAHRQVSQRRVQQVAAAPLQATLLDQPHHALLLSLEQLVQIAE